MAGSFRHPITRVLPQEVGRTRKMAAYASLLLVSLLANSVFVVLGAYTLLKVEVPLDDESLKVFTAEDIKAFDGSDVS